MSALGEREEAARRERERREPRGGALHGFDGGIEFACGKIAHELECEMDLMRLGETRGFERERFEHAEEGAAGVDGRIGRDEEAEVGSGAGQVRGLFQM